MRKTGHLVTDTDAIRIPLSYLYFYHIIFVFDMTSFVSVLCRVCVMCSHLLCPYLVCFLSSLSVIMS